MVQTFSQKVFAAWSRTENRTPLLLRNIRKEDSRDSSEILFIATVAECLFRTWWWRMAAVWSTLFVHLVGFGPLLRRQNAIGLRLHAHVLNHLLGHKLRLLIGKVTHFGLVKLAVCRG